jgi:hypothetical protein
MKTNTISKLVALALLCADAVLGTGSAVARTFQTHVYVVHFPAWAIPGSTVVFPVWLAYQDPGQGGRMVFLPGRKLSVNGYLHGGNMSAQFAIQDVTTDVNGQAMISFRMPHKLRNRGGYEVGTFLQVTAKFAGEAPSLLPGGENMFIDITVR